MSADNGVYILKTPRREDPTQFEYRVAHCQAIDNLIERDASWADIRPAYAVLYFGNSVVFGNKSNALVEAGLIKDKILSDEFCPILEYGICEVQPGFDGPFPDMTTEEAQEDINAFDDPGDTSDDQLS